jgi:hypothetical protein
MGQIRKGTVSVVNGSPTVKHNWTAIFATAPTAPFEAGETIAWTGGGTGTVSRYDSPSKTLLFTRNTGALPVIGALVSNGDDASGTIGELGANDPPGFNLLLAFNTQRWFGVSGDPVLYDVADPVPAQGDSFLLVAPYAGVTNVEASYGITVGFTGWGFPMIESGDANAGPQVSRGAQAIETRAGMYVHVGVNLTLPNFSVTPGPIALDRVIHDPDGWLQGDGTLKVPSGKSIRLIEVKAGLKMVIGGGLYAWEIARGVPLATWDGSPKANPDGIRPIQLDTGPMPVVDGDVFGLFATAVSAGSVQADQLWLKVRVLQ